MDKPLSPVEAAKAASNFLRGTLVEELANSLDSFGKGSIGLLKFHGTYQQDDRDVRKAGPKAFSNMVRVGVPGGMLTPDQYLLLDRLADLGDGSLRITTRQDIQYHYIPKARLKELISSLNAGYLSTLAACGDVVRNVTACPAPIENAQRQNLQPIVDLISRSLKPKTTAYFDVWVNGEKAVSSEVPEPDNDPATIEPLYGATYLPRKFKIGFAYEGDNTTDIYSNDIGIVPHYRDGQLHSFTILAGGGMGQSAGVKASHPRLADPICTIEADTDLLLEVAKAIVTIHRDFGNRSNRKLARLKYVLDEWGVDRFKAELEQRVGRSLPPPVPLSWSRSDDYLGWHRQNHGSNKDAKWFVGVPVVSGRVRDFDNERRLRSGLRTVVERFRPSVRLTAQQNLYFADIAEQDKDAISAILSEHGFLEPQQLPPVLRHAMSCPALPTCGQAITESERIMPAVVKEIQAELNDLGLSDEVVHLRTTGCPNGCARPYTAEIGIVGASVDMYTLYLGASHLGTRLGQEFARNVKRDQVVVRLRPILAHFRESRQTSETFGDFCYRVGIPALQQLSNEVAA